MKFATLCLVVFLPFSAQAEIASEYSDGTATASGERFYPKGTTRKDGTIEYTAACCGPGFRQLPFGTLIKVTYPPTGKSVVVRINDRGPFIKGRYIDLSSGAARRIGLPGLDSVQVEILSETPYNPERSFPPY